jgi:hypothetical protein
VFIVKLAVLFSFITGVALLSSSLVKKFITRPKVKEQFK